MQAVNIARGINLIAYYSLWYFLVSAATQGETGLPLFFSTAYCIAHIYFFVVEAKPAFYLMLLLQLTLGVIAEGFMGKMEFYQVIGENGRIPPLWLISLYPLFSLTCTLFFFSIRNKIFLLSALGLIVAPVTYFSANLLGATEFIHGQIYGLLGIAFTWALVFPLMTRISTTCNWYDPEDSAFNDLQNFSHSSEFQVSKERIFEWHESPTALESLLPSIGSIVKKGESLEVGQEVHIRLGFGPLSTLWVAEHVEYSPHDLFVDRQKKGPFKLWEHRHEFRESCEGSSLLTDSIRFSLLYPKLTHPLLTQLVLVGLRKAFKERHQKTKESLLGQSPMS